MTLKKRVTRAVTVRMRNSDGLELRVRSLMEGLSERNFAQKCEISVGALRGILSGSKPSVDNLLAIADRNDVSLDWLATGTERQGHASAPDLTCIVRHDVQASAGNGRFIDNAPVLNHIPFRPEFFTQNLHRNPSDMIIIDASGDSMQPVMHDRDLLMIDTSTATEVPTGAIYAFTYDDAVFVKRLTRLPGGIEALSANQDYPPFTIKRADMDKFSLIGRVVWIGRML